MEGNPICKMQGCSMDKVKYNIKQIKVKQLKGYKLLSYIGGQEMRNKKKLKQAILNVHVAVVILVITIVSISSSYFVKAEENNKKIIMDVVENYFAERMDVLSKLEMNSSIKNYLLNDIDYYELDTLIKYRKLQIGDLRFKKINQTVELNNIEVEGDKAKVDVVLDEKITFNDSSDVISEESIEHNLTLICINNEWKIQHDDFDSDFKELFEKQQTNTSRKVMSSNNNLRNIQKQILTEEATEVSNKKKELEKIISHYFLILGKTKGKYKISKIIDLYPYNVDSYYSEESTEFYPSQDTKKYLIYNECYINKKDQVIPAKENENLNSILIDFEKDEVKYLKGNQFENLKKENNISEKYLAKQGKASLQLEKYADKEGYIIGESTKYKGQVLCIMKKVKEESILKNKIFEQRNGKIKCIFEFI